MMLSACTVLVFAWAAEARSVVDTTELVQQSIRRDIGVDSTTDLQNPNSSNLTVEYPPWYRINFTRTYGDDHFCLTELEFYDINGGILDASFVSMSSCYGCAIDCEGCTVPYGNAHTLFDRVNDNEGPEGWACSDVGSFRASSEPKTGGYGSTTVTFKMDGGTRPSSYSVRRANLEGDAITRDWNMVGQEKDGSWRILSSVVDAPRMINQTNAVAPDMGPAGRWWEWEDANCLGDYSGGGAVPRVSLDINYEDGRTPFVLNNGRGIHFDDNFGTLSLPSGKYQAKQVHIVYPSQRTVGRDQAVTAPLEMRIVHQKPSDVEPGYEDIVVVAVPLRLPLESESQTADTEQFFVKLGLTNLPAEAAPRTLPKNVTFDLSVFKAQLSGDVDQPPCAGKLGLEDPKAQKWFITRPALVTGAVVSAFKQMFPVAVTSVEDENTMPMTPPFDTLANLGYNQLGKQGNVDAGDELLVPAPPPPPAVNASAPAPPAPSVAQWKHNPVYQPMTGDWTAAGEWELS